MLNYLCNTCNYLNAYRTHTQDTRNTKQFHLSELAALHTMCLLKPLKAGHINVGKKVKYIVPFFLFELLNTLFHERTKDAEIPCHQPRLLSFRDPFVQLYEIHLKKKCGI